MSRTDREVNIYVYHESETPPEGQWFAKVVAQNGMPGQPRQSDEVIYVTRLYPTKDEALADADAWVRTNGRVTMPF